MSKLFLLLLFVTQLTSSILAQTTIPKPKAKPTKKVESRGSFGISDLAQVEKFLSKTRVNFPVLLDPDGKLSDAFEVTAIPSVLLLAKGGEILYYGFQLPDKEKLEAALVV